MAARPGYPPNRRSRPRPQPLEQIGCLFIVAISGILKDTAKPAKNKDEDAVKPVENEHGDGRVPKHF